MTDIVDAATRSRMMRGIRGKNTKPELFVRRQLHAAGFRFRLHAKHLPGKPDIVLAKHRAVVFVSGCFWHGHDCRYFRLPTTRQDFWRKKIEGNQTNDLKVRKSLSEKGWRHATVWECAIRGQETKALSNLGKQLAEWIHSERDSCTIRGMQ